MYIVNLSSRLLFCKPILHLIIILQITASFFVVECATSTLSLTLGSKGYMEELLNSRFCYYSIAERNTIVDKTGNISTTNSSIALEDIISGFTSIIQNDTLVLFADGKSSQANLQAAQILERTKQSFKHGGGFESAQQENGVIRVITNEPDFESGRYYDAEIADFFGNKQSVKIKICGIYPRPAYNMTISTSGSEMSTANIATLMDEYGRYDDCFASVMCLDDYEALIGEKLTHPVNKSAMILFDDDISQAEFDRNIEALRNFGAVSTASEILETTKNDNAFILKTYLPLFIFLLVIAIISMFAVSIINITQQTATLSLYTVLGCSQKSTTKIIYFYVALLCLIPTTIIWVILASSKYFDFFGSWFFTVSPVNYIIPLLLSVLITATVPAAPKKAFKTYSMDYLRKKRN